MHLIVISAPAAKLAYGPFGDALAAGSWLLPLAERLDPAEHSVLSVEVSRPFDLADDVRIGQAGPPWPEQAPATAAAATHAGRAADSRATGFIVRLRDPDTEESGVVGPFACRPDAQAWWDRQASYLHRVDAAVLAIVPPPQIPTLGPPLGRPGW